MKLVKKNIFDEDKTCLWVASVAIGRDGHFFFRTKLEFQRFFFVQIPREIFLLFKEFLKLWVSLRGWKIVKKFQKFR